jgi:hypothetical protein
MLAHYLSDTRSHGMDRSPADTANVEKFCRCIDLLQRDSAFRSKLTVHVLTKVPESMQRRLITRSQSDLENLSHAVVRRDIIAA